MAYVRCSRNILHQIMAGTGFQTADRMLNPLLYAGQGVRYKRKLEVILTTSMDKLGKAGETVKVAPGYFRNYLMPNLLAVPNIEKFANLIEQQRQIYQPKEDDVEQVVAEAEEDTMKEYLKAANRLDKAQLVLRRFTKVDNELRSPVTNEELVAEVARQLLVSIEPENLHLPTPLSSVGVFEVPLRLPKSIPLPPGKVRWILNVKIRRA